MSNDNQSPEGKTKNITFGFVIAWIFAVVVGIPGIMMLFENQVGAGLLFILAALVALPPVNTFVKSKTSISLSGGLRFAIIVVLCIIAGIVVSKNGTSIPTVSSTSPSTTGSTNAPAQPPIKISAVALSDAYNNNEVAADAKYKGNVVDVTGTIDTIGKDILNNPYVTLKTAEYSVLSVQCMFSQSDESTLAALSSGQAITLQGTVSGKTLNVILDGCSVVK